MYRPPLVILNVQPLSTPLLWSESFIAHPRYPLLPPSRGQSIRLNHIRSAPDRLSVQANGLAGHDQSHLLRTCASIRGRFFPNLLRGWDCSLPMAGKTVRVVKVEWKDRDTVTKAQFLMSVLGPDPIPIFPTSTRVRMHARTQLPVC